MHRAQLLIVLAVAVGGGAKAAAGPGHQPVTPPPATSPFAPARTTTTAPLPSPLTQVASRGPADDLFNDGLRRFAQGDARGARRAFYELIKNYPRSQRIASAYVVFGDYYFTQNSMANAQRFYTKVLVGFPRYSHADYVRDRSAWVAFNLGKFQQALLRFTKVVRARPAPHQAVANDALRGMVLAYANIGRPARAFLFFKRMSPQNADRLAEDLARTYHSQGKYAQAVYMFRDLIRRRPRAADVCRWQQHITQAIAALGQNRNTAREAGNLLKLAQSSNSRQCRRRAQAVAYWLATRWHRAAARTKQPALLRHAIDLYRSYARAFPRGRHIAAVRYFRAEALWLSAEQQRRRRLAVATWRAAASAFRAAAQTPGQPRQRRREALRAARLSRARAAHL